MNFFKRIISFFKKTKKVFHKKTWNDITLDQFYKIRDLVEQPDEYTENNIRDLIYGIDSANMPVVDLAYYSIDFLQTPIENKNVKLESTYKLNGHIYRSNINLTEVKTAQFIDFTNYAKEKDTPYEKFLSVFFIPRGHQYNDGYNMTEVLTDLKQLDIVTVQSLTFFMIQQFRAFAIIFQRSLVEMSKTMKPKQKKVIEETAKIIQDLASFQL